MSIRKINSRSLGDGTVVAADVADGSIVNSKLGSGAVTGSKILDGTINSAKLDSTSQPVSFKNRIINGAMMIDQRNGGASVTPTVDPTYTLDRWQVSLSAASKFSLQQSSTAPSGFINSTLITSLSAYSVPAGGYFMLNQPIEGLNVADLGWGTALAQAITISFWVRSSLTGTFGGAIQNGSQNRAYAFSYTISSANTWEQKSVTITGDTTGTWLTTNGVGMFVRFGLGVGSTFSTTAGSWASGQYFAPTGATSVVGTNGATFYITGVQLEKGSVATSFDYRPYGTELALCQRYCEIAVPVTSLYVSGSSNNYAQGAWWKVEKRAAPTVTTYGIGGYPNSSGYYDRDGVGNFAFSSITATVTGFKAGLTSGYSGGCGYKAECEL